MPSKIQVDQIAGATGSTVTLPSGQTLDLSSGTVNLPSASLSALNASNLTSGTVPNARLSGITADKLDLISTASVPSITAKGTPSVSDGYIQLNCEQNSHGIKIKSPPHSAGATYTMVMPSAIGTSNQVLRMNSGATALEFATPAVASSDFVKLYTVTQSSFVSSTVIDGYFDDTIYASYELHIYNLRSSNSNGNHLELRWYSGGSAQTSSLYRWLLNEQYAGGTGAGTGANARGAYNETSWSQLDGTWATSADTIDFQRNLIIQILNPQDTSNAKQLLHQYSVISSDGSRAGGVGFCTYASTASMSGLQIYNNANHKARWTLYGKKK